MKSFFGAACMWLAVSMSASASFGAMDIDRADLIVKCTEYGVWIEGNLDEQVTAVVDYEIFLTPTQPGEPTLMISGTETVVGDADDRFFLRTIAPTAEKICGTYNIKAHAEINGINRVDMQVVEPAGGFLECFCGQLGDFVWLDEDRDGLQGPAEPGLQGIEVRLRGFDNEGRELELIATSDEDGFYSFEDLCPGDYRVDVHEESIPPGLSATEPNVGEDDSLDSDGPLDGGFVQVNLPDQRDPDDLTIDFGFVEEAMTCEGRIGDFVWRDLDQDGAQGPNDPAIAGVVVELFDAAGVLLASQETNEAGIYVFGALCAGDYSVAFRPDSVPAGLSPTLVDAADDSLDSDPSPQAVELETNSSIDFSNDFGFIEEPVDCTGRLGDFVWDDLNQNGMQSNSEPGLEGVRLILRDMSGNEVDRQFSGADGSYFFEGLCAGGYSVEWDGTTLPPGYLATDRNVGDDMLDSDESPKLVQLPSDEAQDTSIDFGFFEQPVGTKIDG